MHAAKRAKRTPQECHWPEKCHFPWSVTLWWGQGTPRIRACVHHALKTRMQWEEAGYDGFTRRVTRGQDGQAQKPE